MKRNLMFLALATLGLASCNGGFKKGDGGLLYNIHVDKGGPKVQEGDFISVDLVVKTDGDSVLFSTYEAGHPSLTVLQKPQARGDIYAGIKLLAEGDSATVKTCMDSLFKKGQRRPPFKGKYIVYEVKVDKVIAKGKLPDSVFHKEIESYMKIQTDMMRKEEPLKVKKYIADNKLTVTTTPSGLNYIITKPGSGDKPAIGDTAEVFYTAKYLTGKIFETNVKAVAVKNKTYNPMMQYKPIRIPVGVRGVIPGWDEGLLLLNKGAEATFIIPSKLAYGEQGYQIIPPFTPLIFEVQLVGFIHPDPNAKKPAPPVPVAPVQLQKPAAK
jgi:FKBP-type peptidyl-prolyl cis-trans isomerase FkpA